MDEDARQYLQQHRIHHVLETLVSEVVKEKPAEPIEYIIDRLTEMQKQQTGGASPEPANAGGASAGGGATSAGAGRGDSTEPTLNVPDNIDLRTSEGIEFIRSAFRERSDGGLLTKQHFTEVLRDFLGHEDGEPPSDVLGQLYTIFDTFDKDRSGAVDLEEFTQGMRILFSGSESEILEFAFSGLDFNNDGGVSVEEFINYFHNYFVAKSAVEGRKLEPQRWHAIRDHLRRVFQRNDADGSGAIDLDEFRKAVIADPDHPFTLIWASFASPSPSQGGRGRRRSLSPGKFTGSGGSGMYKSEGSMDFPGR